MPIVFFTIFFERSAFGRRGYFFNTYTMMRCLRANFQHRFSKQRHNLLNDTENLSISKAILYLHSQELLLSS